MYISICKGCKEMPISHNLCYHKCTRGNI
uniref:Uncharacterized protein n=1 Tax=Arundo donax TaxID=35708 RepID=A0A0A9T107_ARUDO